MTQSLRRFPAFCKTGVQFCTLDEYNYENIIIVKYYEKVQKYGMIRKIKLIEHT